MPEKLKTPSHPAEKLTASSIAAKKPEESPYVVSDTFVRGLSLRVSPQGAKTFRYRARGLGKVFTLGAFSATSGPGLVTLHEARAWVERLRQARKAGGEALATVEAELRAHVTPAAVPAIADHGKTIDEIVIGWWKVLERQRKRGSDEVQPVYRKHIQPVIGAMTLQSIKKSDCRAVVDRAYAGGAHTHAGKVLAILKQLLDFAERQFGGEDFVNPAARLKAADFAVETNMRERWLDEKEIPAFWNAVGDSTEPEREPQRRKMAAVLRLLLLIGTRSGELRQARWEQVDLEAKTFTVPVLHQKLTPKQAKKAQPFVIPLTPTAVQLFEELRKLARGAPFVLPSAGSKTGVYDDKSIARFMRRLWVGEDANGTGKLTREATTRHPALADFEEATPHDLRRTARTWLGKLGVPPHICERCLNHRLGRIIDTYDRGDYLEERRAALELWDAKIQEFITAWPAGGGA